MPNPLPIVAEVVVSLPPGSLAVFVVDSDGNARQLSVHVEPWGERGVFVTLPTATADHRGDAVRFGWEK